MHNHAKYLYKHVLDDINMYREVKGLKELTADVHPSLAENASEAAQMSLVNSITKKWLPKSNKELAERAIKLFQANNDLCAIEPSPCDLLSEMRRVAYLDLPPIGWQELLGNARFGPGSSVGSQGRNSFFEKFFVNSLTTTEPALYTEYRSFMRTRSTWLAAELKRIRIQGGEVFRVVAGSKLTTVAKNNSIDRTICTEPSLNMMFQLCLGDAFNDVLRKVYGYDQAIQPNRNREMSWAGSLGNGQCTIDLRSASDTISLSLCRAVLPEDWFAAISDCRSPTTEVDGKTIDLNMVSSMGNGFTFPLQTYLFSLLIRCVCRIKQRHFERFSASDSFGVFGDDLVVPRDIYDDVIAGLESLGFQPNNDKSFGDGSFRESCGSDWFEGTNVRGVYGRKLDCLQDRFSLINRLLRWSAMHGIPLNKSIGFILPKGWRKFLVPPDEADTAGIKVPMLVRPNRRLFYTAYSVKSKKLRILKERKGELGTLKAGWDNPSGYILAASAGALKGGCLDRRPDRVNYVLEQRFTPGWDNPVELRRHGIDFVDWENQTWACLTSMP
jgi:hypothetical protein